jgi:hypothetical protein
VVVQGFFFFFIFCYFLLFGIFFWLFLFILEGGRGHEFFFIFSILELGKWVWVLLFHLLLFF